MWVENPFWKSALALIPALPTSTARVRQSVVVGFLIEVNLEVFCVRVKTGGDERFLTQYPL